MKRNGRKQNAVRNHSEVPAVLVGEDDIPDSLSADEQEQLERCERMIRKHEGAFFEYAFALLQIRDKRLYRSSHPSFQSYCREKLGWSRAYALRIAQAGEVIEGLPDGVRSLVKNEHTARILSRVAEGHRETILKQVQASGRPVSGPSLLGAARGIDGALKDREAGRLSEIGSASGQPGGADHVRAIEYAVFKLLHRLASRLAVTQEYLGTVKDGGVVRSQVKKIHEAIESLKLPKMDGPEERRCLLAAAQWIASKRFNDPRKGIVLALTAS